MKFWPIIIALLLIVIPVSANEPTQETACCLDFERGYPSLDQCNQYEINEERCSDIVKQWNRTVRMTNSGGFEVIALFGSIGFLTWLAIGKIRAHKKSKKKK